MKKCICIFLCVMLALSLCACSGGKGENGEKLYFSLSVLPDPPESAKKDTAVYYGNKAENSFSPSDGYKSVVPYIAKTEKPFYSGASKETVYGCSLGLATKEGEIITGGIYRSIEWRKTADGQLLYFCSPYSRTKDGSDSTLIIPSDGSFAVSTDKTCVFCEDTAHRHSCFAADGIIYDSNGDRLIDCSALCPENRIFRIYYYDGDKIIFSLITNKYNEYEYKKENAGNIYYYCMDTEGSLLYEIEMRDGYFIDGQYGGAFVISRLSDESGEREVNLCDLFGNRLLDIDYSDIRFDEKQRFFVCFGENGKTDTVKPSGELINSFSVTQEDENAVRCILTSDTSALFTADFYRLRLNEQNDKKEAFQWLDLITGEKIEPDHADMRDVAILGDSRVLIMNGDGSGDIYEASGAYAFSVGDIKEVLASDGDVFVYTDSKGSVTVKSYGRKTLLSAEGQDGKAIGAELTGDYIILGYDNEKTETYRISTGEKLSDETGSISLIDTPFGSYYGFCSTEVSGLIGPDGSRLIAIYDDSLI